MQHAELLERKRQRFAAARAVRRAGSSSRSPRRRTGCGPLLCAARVRRPAPRAPQSGTAWRGSRRRRGRGRRRRDHRRPRGREHQNLALRLLARERAAHLIAMQLGQVAIKDHDVVRMHPRLIEPKLAIAGGVDGRARLAQAARDGLGDPRMSSTTSTRTARAPSAWRAPGSWARACSAARRDQSRSVAHLLHRGRLPRLVAPRARGRSARRCPRATARAWSRPWPAARRRDVGEQTPLPPTVARARNQEPGSAPILRHLSGSGARDRHLMICLR